jgi:putative heavy-metal-binding protein
MYLSFSNGLDDGRPMTAIGRIRAPTRWRAAGDPGAEADRQEAIEALKREAEEYGADAVIEVRFEVDGVKGPEVEGVALQRLTATGLAVRFARAA